LHRSAAPLSIGTVVPPTPLGPPHQASVPDPGEQFLIADSQGGGDVDRVDAA